MRLSDWRQLCAAALLLISHQAALAHAHAQNMQPAANSVVHAPTMVRMQFSEALEPALSTLTVRDDKGQAVAGQTAFDKAAPNTMQLRLPVLATGRYHVHWVAVADDGHRTQGDYVFQVQ